MEPNTIYTGPPRCKRGRAIGHSVRNRPVDDVVDRCHPGLQGGRRLIDVFRDADVVNGNLTRARAVASALDVLGALSAGRGQLQVRNRALARPLRLTALLHGVTLLR